MSLNPNAPSFDPTAKPFIPSFLCNDPEQFVPPVYHTTPQFNPQLRGLAGAGPVSNDDVPLLSGFKRTSKPVATAQTPSAENYEAPNNIVAAGAKKSPTGLPGQATGGSGGPPMMWQSPSPMLGAAESFPNRPMMNPNAAMPSGASMPVGAAQGGSRVNTATSLSSGMGTDAPSERFDGEQPPILGRSSSSMRRPPSTSPSGSPLSLQQQQLQNAGARYTAPQQPALSQSLPPAIPRSQDRSGQQMGGAPLFSSYGVYPHAVPGGNTVQPHSPAQGAPPSQRPLPQQHQQHPHQHQQPSFPQKAALVLPRSAQERQAAAAAAANEGSRGASPSSLGQSETGNGVPGRIPAQEQRGPSPPTSSEPLSETVSQQHKQPQQQQQGKGVADSTTPAPRQAAGNLPMSAPVPPRISSAPMARAVRVGAVGGSAAYSAAVAATTAAPYPGPARGLLPLNHAGGASHLPRAPPTAAASHGATLVSSAGSSSGNTAPGKAPQPASSVKPASGPATSTLTTTTTPAPRPVPVTSVAALSGWKPPQFGRKASPTNSDPLIVMIFGCRGSGKTTQAENIAERYHLLHLSSGDMYKEGKQPFAEVEQTVKDHFGPTAKDRSYNGLVLDRFVATGEMDAYYLQAALKVCQLPVPLVFWLQVDPKEGLRRAQSRGDQKTGADHWRYVEQRAQAEIADRVYKKIGALHIIDCNTLDARRVGDRIYSIIDGLFPKRSRNIRLPPATPIAGYDKLPLLDDYSDFQQLTKEVHAAIGNTAGRTDSAPLSTIGGYVDANSFANRQECKRMSSMYVTLKVDGLRYLVVKHSHFGVLGFPFAFTGCYDFNILFDPLMFPNAVHMAGDRHDEVNGIEWMLDAEMSTTTGESNQPQPLLHIIDYVYFGGKQAKRTPFFERYELLREWFRLMIQNSGEAGAYAPVVLKHYAPINELPRLLPRLEEAPFAVDGVVFQGNTVYKFGVDKFLLKWKPLQLCTADFRLMNGEKTEDGITVFDLFTTDSEQEVPFPGAVGVFTEMQMHAYQLRNSAIVELELADVVERAGPNGQPATQWVFHRLRVDKPRPNKTSVVESIVKLKHLTYQELLDHCRVLRFTSPNTSSS